MEYENIQFEQDGKVATVIFNRPKSLNALNQALLSELSSVLDQLAMDENISVVILTGAGGKAFVAGADIKELSTLSPLQAKLLAERGQGILSKLESLPQPVIGAVNGFALGGGMELALACDFIYASENAQFGLPEINLGIIPGYGGTQRLSRLIGKNGAKELIMSGKMISAAEAKELGIVNTVCEADSLIQETSAIASQIAAKGKVALRAAKQAINDGSNTDLKTGLAVEVNQFALTVVSGDAQEGMRAFIEKKKPDFRGCLNE